MDAFQLSPEGHPRPYAGSGHSGLRRSEKPRPWFIRPQLHTLPDVAIARFRHTAAIGGPRQ